MSFWKQLDEAEIHWQPKTGGQYLAGVLVFELRFLMRSPHSPEVRAGAVAGIDRLRELIPDQTYKWFWTREGAKPSKMPRDLPPASQILADAIAAKDAFNYLATDCGDPYRDAYRHYLKVRLRDDLRTTPNSVGSFHLRVPLPWVEARGGGTMIDLFLELARLLKPCFGSAGLALSAPIHAGGKQMHAAYSAYPFLKRFPGVDSGEASYVADEISHFYPKTVGGMTTINWLNAVDGPTLDLCGGDTAARSAFGMPDFPVYTFDGGIVVQAGPNPQMGDNLIGLPLTHYAHVARFFKPARMLRTLSVNPAYAPEGSNLYPDRYESAQIEYLNRFDDMESFRKVAPV
ncbi:type VI immunity family protein [Cystobacter fuscus]|uniref:type VI immunity family protein n=1 Tax=Cystobacter fuscus TaxID=43 RepID=UPI002B2E9048|nr:DUF3396 domain-containing protein [Cystobacter fuscus]